MVNKRIGEGKDQADDSKGSLGGLYLGGFRLGPGTKRSLPDRHGPGQSARAVPGGKKTAATAQTTPKISSPGD